MLSPDAVDWYKPTSCGYFRIAGHLEPVRYSSHCFTLPDGLMDRTTTGDMKRRSVLALGSSVTITAVAGCGGFVADESNGRPWPASDPIVDPAGTHHLFVENHTSTTETAWLRVVREDGATLVDGRFELPDGRAIRFDDIATWETTYTIDIAIEGEAVRSLEWYTAECGSGAEAQGSSASRNAAVRVEAPDGDRVGIRVDECDAIIAGRLPTGSAESFRLPE